MNKDALEIEKAESLALDILTLSRNTLLVNLRFLEPAFHRLSFTPDPETSLATDGFFVYYGFLHILRTYQMKKEQIARDYLHTVLHCIFHHPFVGTHVDALYWDLACDIAVEAVIHELDLPHTDCPKAHVQEDDLQELRSYVQPLTAEKIYHYLKHCDFSVEELLTLRDPFLADDHAAWYEHSEVPSQENSSSEDTTSDSPEDSFASENEEGSSEQNNDLEGESSENGNNESPSANDTEDARDNTDGEKASGAPSSSISSGDFPSISPDQSKEECKKEWEEISDHIRTDLETFSQSYGKAAGLFLSNIRECRREPFDYSSFLRQFAVLGEEIRLNDDEFDYIYYMYGLKLYENMPLIEPLEYKEMKKIREFVIAIDTSASVSGALVHTFIQKTYNILKEEESFFEQIILYIIQCDSQIQEIKKITSQKELDAYLTVMQLHGFGGTDFRPVFQYVEQLQDTQQLTELKGLLYFTDGNGVYPQSRPAYETAFVFVEPEQIPSNPFQPDDLSNDSSVRSGFALENVTVPVWAIKVVLSEQDLSESITYSGGGDIK